MPKTTHENPQLPSARPAGSEIDVEVVITEQPRAGVSRHIGGVYPGTMRDDALIASALHKIADNLLRPPNVPAQRPPAKDV